MESVAVVNYPPINSIPLFTSQPMAITPRPYQVSARDSIFTYYASKKDNPLVVMPTGTGKSIVIAMFIAYTLQRWQRQRIICLTHVKELIEQNAEKLQLIWPTAPVGIFSAGLGIRDVSHPIVYGGIASAVKCIERFGFRDLLLVDEAHLIGPDTSSMYKEAIAGLKRINSNLRVIGFTATPYRTGQGLLTEGEDRIFTDICYDLSTMSEFNKLIDEGYLCPLIPRRTQVELDTSSVSLANGDFAPGQLERAVDLDELTYRACKEIVENGQNRQCWMIFASGVKHAEHIATCLQTFGINAVALSSKNKNRDRIIADFRAGNIQCLVVYGIGTTGFDVPQIDLIGMLRPTMSTGLWVQMLGRGTRPCEGKDNCLVLDFAANTRRLGPINDPVIPKRRVKGATPGDAPVKICPVCGTYNHTRAVECCDCGHHFESSPNLLAQAATDALIRSDLPEYKEYPVQSVIYNRHQKDAEHKPGIKVSYFCGLKLFHDWVFLEHGGFAAKKARNWWRQRTDAPVPATTDEALQLLSTLKKPRMIRVWINKKYPEVTACLF